MKSQMLTKRMQKHSTQCQKKRSSSIFVTRRRGRSGRSGQDVTVTLPQPRQQAMNQFAPRRATAHIPEAARNDVNHLENHDNYIYIYIFIYIYYNCNCIEDGLIIQFASNWSWPHQPRFLFDLFGHPWATQLCTADLSSGFRSQSCVGCIGQRRHSGGGHGADMDF